MPAVSVIVPCRNERETIVRLLAALRDQDFPPSEMEVVIADGMSTDGTRQAVREYASSNPGLSIALLDNPERSIPAGLNRAIQRARGDVIVRLDAHSVPAPDYVARCVETLRRTSAANVGGLWVIRAGGPGPVARAIAVAGSNPLGAGDARYRVSGPEGPVETVPFGAYPRPWLERVGGFDEALRTNEDYELNHRLRLAGGQVWFNPAIRSEYRARGSLPELASQYARYGFWKGRMLARYPGSLRWRQALPPLFVLSLLGLAAAAIRQPRARGFLGVECIVYLGVVVGVSLWEAVRRHDLALLPGVAAALITMHLGWGSAFWVGWLRGWPRGSRKG